MTILTSLGLYRLQKSQQSSNEEADSQALVQTESRCRKQQIRAMPDIQECIAFALGILFEIGLHGVFHSFSEDAWYASSGIYLLVALAGTAILVYAGNHAHHSATDNHEALFRASRASTRLTRETRASTRDTEIISS